MLRQQKKIEVDLMSHKTMIFHSEQLFRAPFLVFINGDMMPGFYTGLIERVTKSVGS